MFFFALKPTAQEILDLLKTVDGVDSGLDSDSLQGNTPASFAQSIHVHDYASINDVEATFSEMLSDATVGDLWDVSYTPAISIGHFLRVFSTGTVNPELEWRPAFVDYSEITNKPTTFAPAAHTQDANTITTGVFNTARIPTLNQSTTGSAATLTTARTFTVGSTGKTFNGSANVSWSLAEISTDIATLNTTQTFTGVKTFTSTPYLSSNQFAGLYFSSTGADINKKNWSLTTGSTTQPYFALQRRNDDYTFQKTLFLFNHDDTLDLNAPIVSAVTINNTTNATSTTSAASIKTAGGIACAGAIYANTLNPRPPEGASSVAQTFHYGYQFYVDNVGAGSGTSRFWLAAPNLGSIYISPRSGGQVLEVFQVRANNNYLFGKLHAPSIPRQTSPTGLASGEIWCDTANGNVLKIV